MQPHLALTKRAPVGRSTAPRVRCAGSGLPKSSKPRGPEDISRPIRRSRSACPSTASTGSRPSSVWKWGSPRAEVHTSAARGCRAVRLNTKSVMKSCLFAGHGELPHTGQGLLYSAGSPTTGSPSEAHLLFTAFVRAAQSTNGVQTCAWHRSDRRVRETSRIINLLQFVLWNLWSRGARVWARRWATRTRCPRSCPHVPEGSRRSEGLVHRSTGQPLPPHSSESISADFPEQESPRIKH